MRLEDHEQDQHDQRAQPAHQEIADRHDAHGRPGDAGQHRRDDRGAEIDAEHQDDAEFGRDQAAAGERRPSAAPRRCSNGTAR